MKKRGIIYIVLVLIIIFFIVINLIIDARNERLKGLFTTDNEFLKTNNYAELFSKYQDNTLLLSFDACAEKEGDIVVYMQNGETSRYTFKEQYIHVGTEWNHYEIEIIPHLTDEYTEEAYLAFYGGYGTGIKPMVRNINIEPVRSN